jgi:outer membrane protein TolC
VKQLELIRKSSDYSLENASKGYLPQVSINGQATYQSEVTRIPINIPNMTVPTLSKDQYKLYAEVNQVVYDGGAIAQQQKVLEASRATEEQKIEVELYKLKERINQLYFGILLIDGQLEQTALLRKDLELGITKTNALIDNGTALKSTVNVLKAEVLKTNQRITELKALRRAYTDMLGLFIQQPLHSETQLATPAAVQAQTEIRRPELTLYALQQQSVDAGYGLLAAKNRPKVSLFVQGGYGRPALNMLSNDFEPYAIGGVRLNWSLSGLYTLKNERAVLEVNRSTVDLQRELFLLNTQITLRQQNAEVTKLQELLQTDDAIIDLRTSTKTVSASQLENGVINANDYLRDVNAEDQARLNKLLHEIQLLQAQYNQQITTGI